VLQQQWDELLVVRLQVSTSGGDCRGHAAAKRRRAGQCEAQSAIIGRAWNLFDTAGRMGSGSNREPSASRAGAPSGQGVFARTLWPQRTAISRLARDRLKRSAGRSLLALHGIPLKEQRLADERRNG
jgi:hypothetical protein